MSYLEYTLDDKREEEQLVENLVSIGRGKDCTIQILTDGEISRLHCTVRHLDDKRWVVVDEGARNGTSVNDERIEEGVGIILKDGDRIGIGQTIFTFHKKEVEREAALFNEVEQQMKDGAGYHTILHQIIEQK
ncbi:MAG: FHA domain-containing protein [Lentisphaeria bacterium]|nr:FHA domain-containing protein [Lentisphaeria bacterium]